MALSKQLTLDSGAVATYHNIPKLEWLKSVYKNVTPAIPAVQEFEVDGQVIPATDEVTEQTEITITKRAVIYVDSYANKAARDDLKATMRQTSYVLDSDNALDLTTAYDYLKTQPEFEGATDV